MIADYWTMPRMYSECNRKYFGHSLPTPKFGLMKKLNTLAKFTAVKDKKSKHGLKQMRVLFSEYYDFDEAVFRDLMVHEMIHYYLAWNGIDRRCRHGKEFMAMAAQLNEQYGLNVTKTLDASHFRRTENAPKRNSLLRWLTGKR